MNETTIKQIIRKSVKAQIKEAAAKSSRPPATWSDFRKMFAAALKKSGAPRELVSAAADLGYEGGQIVETLYGVWSNIESEMRSGGSLSIEEWDDAITDYAHDAVYDMLDGLYDPMEYDVGDEPNRHAGDDVDVEKLATDVAAAMTLGKNRSS
jgi:hypothetical protein